MLYDKLTQPPTQLQPLKCYDFVNFVYSFALIIKQLVHLLRRWEILCYEKKRSIFATPYVYLLVRFETHFIKSAFLI